MEQLKHVVATNSKKRFAFSEDGTRIRASQGHSVDVDLQYAPQVPPEVLYRRDGPAFPRFHPAERPTEDGAPSRPSLAETVVTTQVGARHGKPTLLTIRAGEMQRTGHVFYRSANGVWLVDHVPPQFIVFTADSSPSEL